MNTFQNSIGPTTRLFLVLCGLLLFAVAAPTLSRVSAPASIPDSLTKQPPTINALRPGAAQTIYKPRCDRPRDADEFSLCQNLEAMRIADRNFWVGLLGALAVVATLFFTARAAEAATRAARAAEASVDQTRNDAAEQSERFREQIATATDSVNAAVALATAASAANEIANDALNWERRPWLRADLIQGDELATFRVREDDIVTPIKLRLHNHGRSPAEYDVIFTSYAGTKYKKPSELPRLLAWKEGFLENPFKSIIFPGETITLGPYLVENKRGQYDKIVPGGGKPDLITSSVACAVYYCLPSGERVFETSHVHTWDILGPSGDPQEGQENWKEKFYLRAPHGHHVT